MKKRIFALLLLLVVAGSSQAILPAAVVSWLLQASGGSLLLSDLVVGLSGVVAGVLYLDCSYQWTSCTDKTGSASAINATGNSAQKPMTVDLRPTAARPNPNTARFDNPAAGARDVTPKASFVPTAGFPTLPGNYPAVITDMGGAGYKEYSSGGYKRAVTVKTTKLPSETASWQGTVTINGTSAYYYVFDVATQIVTGCGDAPGYVLQGSNCVLSDASQVVKPSSTPCQVLYDNAHGFLFDDKNPNCSGLASSLVNPTTKILTVSSSDGSNTVVAPQSGGGFQLTKTKTDGTWTTVTTAPYDANQGGYPVTGSSSGTGPAPSGSGAGGSSSGGSSGGSCGGTGQPACKIDETGTPGAPSFTGLDGALNGMVAGYESRVSSQMGDDHGITWGSLFPDLFFGAPRVTCQPVVIRLSQMNFGGQHVAGDMTFDLCSNMFFLQLRDLLKWLAYVGGVGYIYRRFLSAEMSGVKTE